METAIALQVIPMLVDRLITHLYELRTAKKHNKQVVEETGKFTETLNSNLELLRTKLPKSVSTRALESLAQELGNANNFMEECLSQGTFKKFWNAKETRENLESLRKKLASAFQTTFFITSLDVGIDAHKNMANFQERMLQLKASNARDSAAQIRELLQPLLSGAGREEKVQTAIACVEEIRVNRETESSETGKFFADVLAAINQLPNNSVQDGSSHFSESFDDEEFYDPITQELMCDPVKGSDGFTYDRWMILDNEIYRSPMTQEPLSIVCDDVNVRRRLFQKFQNHGLEKKFSEKREEYREQTLELARNGHDAEALGRLENVLTWAKGDSECQAFQLAIRDRLHGSASNSNQAQSQAGARHSRMSSEPVQKSTMQGPTGDLLTRNLMNLYHPQLPQFNCVQSGIDADKNMTDFQERILQHFDSDDWVLERFLELLEAKIYLTGGRREGKVHVRDAFCCIEEMRGNTQPDSSHDCYRLFLSFLLFKICAVGNHHVEYDDDEYYYLSRNTFMNSEWFSKLLVNELLVFKLEQCIELSPQDLPKLMS